MRVYGNIIYYSSVRENVMNDHRFFALVKEAKDGEDGHFSNNRLQIHPDISLTERVKLVLVVTLVSGLSSVSLRMCTSFSASGATVLFPAFLYNS